LEGCVRERDQMRRLGVKQDWYWRPAT